MDNEDYTTAKTFIHTVKTTNDLAERAVKMATDFSDPYKEQGHQEEDNPGGGGPQEGLPRLQEVNFLPLILAHIKTYYGYNDLINKYLEFLPFYSSFTGYVVKGK